MSQKLSRVSVECAKDRNPATTRGKVGGSQAWSYFCRQHYLEAIGELELFPIEHGAWFVESTATPQVLGIFV